MYIIVYHSPSQRFYFNGFQINYSFKPKIVWKTHDDPNMQFMLFASKERAQQVINEDIRQVDGSIVADHCSIHHVSTTPVT